MTKLNKVDKIDHGIEELILTGMIIDSNFLNRFHSMTKPEYFESDMISIIAEWVLDYGNRNNWEAPNDQIMNLFKLNKGDFDEDEAKTVRIFLKRLIETYQTRPFNALYVQIRAIPYMKKQAYKYYLERANKLLARDRIDEAVELFHSIPTKVAENVRNWVDFDDPALVNLWWDNMHNSFINFPGALGEYLPKIRAGKLYTLLAPAKRGKSWWLLYWAFIAAMDGLNVVFFSLEMGEEEVHERLTKMISGMSGSKEKEKVYTLPIIDCVHNQTGECERKECASPKTTVAKYEGNEIVANPYDRRTMHRPCIKCMGTERFKPTSYFEEFSQKTLTKKIAKKSNKKFKTHIGGSNLKIISYPINTATPEDIERDLDSLEREGFHADCVSLDYAQILKMDTKINDKRNQINNVYMECSRIAKSRGVALITGSQGNRGATKKNSLSLDDIAEDFGIAMIIDCIIAINEENQDKADSNNTDRYWQRQNVETLALRYGKHLPGKKCVVLNDFERGQVNLDSYIV